MKKTENNPDPKRLRVLVLEDNRADAELVEHELHRAGIVFQSRLVEGKIEFSKALAEFQPQVILSDFKLPFFDGQAALETARVRAPEIPFIFVSGSIGEEKAIAMLTQGASDYIFKDNLHRLGPAVKRVVEAARLKLEKENSDEELRCRVDELRLLAAAADRFVHINDLDKIYDYLAQTIRDISGADYLLLSLFDEKLQAVRPKVVIGFEPFRETLRRRFQIDLLQVVFYLEDMRPDDFKDFVSRRLLPVRDGLYGLANRKIPRAICRLIEKMLAVGSMHTMGFSWENQLYGGLTVVFKKGKALQNQAQVETLLNQATVSIKRLLAERSLRESEERFRRISETMSDISYSCDRGPDESYSLSWMTGATDHITGYSIEELMAMKCWGKLVLAENLPDFEKYVTNLTPGNSGICELRLRHKNGDTVWVQSFAECTQNPDQPEQRILYGGLVDISERKRMYDQLRQSEEYYRTLVQTSPDAIIIIDGGGRVTFASHKTLEVFGIPAQTSIIGISIMDFVEPDEVPRVQGRMVEILSGRSLPQINEYRLLKHDRRPFWGEISSSPLQDASGRSIGLLLVCRDVSERKQAEEQIRAALEEKEVLLQEIHHRVKNNLQIISGLLTLQADQSAGRPLSEIFHESQDRIRSIALIHEKLYRSRNLAEIAFDEYLRTLTENLFISHGIVAGRITVTYEMEPILFTIEKAIPLGLIVNELLTNALKHAFPAGQQGEIRITLHRGRGVKFYAPTEDTGTAPGTGTAHRSPTYELFIADNGIGLPAGFKPDTQKSLGMHLVSMLANQIQAELRVKTGQGTEFRLLFSGQPANAVGKE